MKAFDIPPPNKALHPTANPLRGLAAAERNRSAAGNTEGD